MYLQEEKKRFLAIAANLIILVFQARSFGYVWLNCYDSPYFFRGDYVVIGLGNFGKSLALNLAEEGKNVLDEATKAVKEVKEAKKAPKKSTLSEQAEDYRTALNSYEEQIIKEKEPQPSPDDDMGWIDKLIKEIEEEQKNG